VGQVSSIQVSKLGRISPIGLFRSTITGSCGTKSVLPPNQDLHYAIVYRDLRGLP
jgi:hypothetical protein